jgi:hypothetical protein
MVPLIPLSNATGLFADSIDSFALAQFVVYIYR